MIKETEPVQCIHIIKNHREHRGSALDMRQRILCQGLTPFTILKSPFAKGGLNVPYSASFKKKQDFYAN